MKKYRIRYKHYTMQDWACEEVNEDELPFIIAQYDFYGCEYNYEEIGSQTGMRLIYA